MQVSILTFILLFAYSHTIKPPGFVEKSPEKAENQSPPKYEYGYDIVGEHGGHQGKQEQRDGIYASGRYFVENKNSKSDVQYFADDWGYHPAVEYSNVGAHSKSSVRLALDHEAVQQLRNKEKNLPQLQDLPDIGPLNKNGAAAASPNAASPAPSQQIFLQQPKQDPQVPYNPFKEQQNIYQQQPQQYLQQQQIVLQHVPQPAQKLIFPQPTVLAPLEDNQQPKQLLLQQPDLPYLDQQQYKTEQEQTKLVFPQPTAAPLHQQLLLQQPDILLQQQRTLPDCDHQPFGLRLNGRRPNKLIDTTQNLVTGQDVVDINNSVSNYHVTATTAGSTITDFQGTESTEPSLGTQPIIAAEYDENKVFYSSTTEQYSEQQIVSSTPGTIQPAELTSTIVVTPRPSGTTYLDSTVVTEQLDNLNKQDVQVDLQKPVPYYLGKYEYPLSQDQHSNGTTVIEQKINQDIELGKTLLYFPGQQLPHQAIQNNFVDQGYHYPAPPKEVLYKEEPQQVYQQQIYFNHKQVPNQGYPIKVPYPVIKQVSVPVTVEKVIEKPVHITKIVEKPVPVPQPYPVEKIVEKPVHVPVQVTKYVDRPYPVQVQVPVPQPYPVHVDRIVEKKVHVPQYIDRPYPVQVQVPYAVPVDRIVEKKVPIDRVIEKKVPVPYPVKVEVPVPQPYYIKVEVPRPYPVQLPAKYIEKPYYTLGVVKYQSTNYGNIGANYQQANYADVKNIQQGYQHSKYIEKQPYLIASNDGSTNKGTTYEQGYHYPNPYSYAPQNNAYLPPKEEPSLNNGYLPPNGGRNCDDGYHQGLLPPKSDNPLKFLGKFRAARSSFNEKSVKMEYGFRPPMVPSLEIDEFGQPVEK